MKSDARTKVIKEILVDVDKCNGCRTCEMACSAFHATPKYSGSNPARSRIQVIMDENKDMYIPVRAGDYARAECNGRNLYTIDGKEYTECTFCPVSCPSRPYFKEPDSGLPLKCDMCEDDPALPEPMCVTACKPGALTYREYEVEVAPEAPARGELEIGIESLVKRYGAKRVRDIVARLKS